MNAGKMIRLPGKGVSMKFIHTSDLHLGKRVSGYPMIEEQKHILMQIAEAVREEQADALIIAGDVYDRSSPSSEAVALYDDFLSGLSDDGIRVLVISGNHDMAQSIAFGSRIMDRNGIHLSPVYDGSISPVVFEDGYGTVSFYLLPFLRPANVRACLPDEDAGSYTDAVRAAVAAMDIDMNARNVLVTHQFVTGSMRSESEDVSVGGTDGVDAAVFEGIDYVALGHLHRPQQAGRETVRYSGSPLKYSVSEAGDTKSATVVTMGEKGDIAVKTRKLTPLHDLRRIKGSYDELVSKDHYENTAVDDYLHIILTDEDEVVDVLRKLRTIYPNIMKLEYENRRTSYDNVLESAGGAGQMSPLELFEELFEKQNNREMSEEQRDYLKDMISSIWEEEQ